MALNALAYLRNVGKSFGYAAIDVFNQYNPTVSALFSETKSLSSDLYQSIKDFSAKKVSFNENSLVGQIRGAAKDVINNTIADIKSGNLYNKQRADKIMEESMGFGDEDFGDFDFEFDFDDGDTAAEITAQEKSTEILSNTISESAQKATGAIATATVRSADYIVESGRANTKAIYDLTSSGFSKMTTGLGAINSNISTLVELGKPLTQHMQNAGLFYTKSTEFQEKSLKLLEQIANNTAPKTPEFKKKGSKEFTMADAITADGLLDIRAFRDHIKDYVKTNLDMVKALQK